MTLRCENKPLRMAVTHRNGANPPKHVQVPFTIHVKQPLLVALVKGQRFAVVSGQGRA